MSRQARKSEILAYIRARMDVTPGFEYFFPCKGLPLKDRALAPIDQMYAYYERD